jgi:hypothetical protein
MNKVDEGFEFVMDSKKKNIKKMIQFYGLLKGMEMEEYMQKVLESIVSSIDKENVFDIIDFFVGNDFDFLYFLEIIKNFKEFEINILILLFKEKQKNKDLELEISNLKNKN